MQSWWTLLAAAAVMTFPWARAGADDPPTLQQQLARLDDLRNGAATRFDLVEEQGRQLLAQYPAPADRAKIHYQLAHVYAQSDVRTYPDRVTRYARLALEAERDPVRRGRLFVYLGGAAEVDPAHPTPAARRAAAALAYLEGYKDLVALNLPAIAPDLPGVMKLGDEAGDPKEAAERAKQHAAQMRARQEAEVVRALVEERQILFGRLTALYPRTPEADAELRRLAGQVLGHWLAVDRLMERLDRFAAEPFAGEWRNVDAAAYLTRVTIAQNQEGQWLLKLWVAGPQGERDDGDLPLQVLRDGAKAAGRFGFATRQYAAHKGAVTREGHYVVRMNGEELVIEVFDVAWPKQAGTGGDGIGVRWRYAFRRNGDARKAPGP